MRPISLALLCLLAACQRTDTSPAAPVVDATSGAGLERAALETGVITDATRVSPVGFYRRRHEAGSDSLCVIPGKAGAFHFGAEATFGAEEHCRGTGTARRAGDKLILSFAGGNRCIVVAQFDGDQVALPGVVDVNCAKICDGRGSIEGVSFPRVASDARAALRARDGEGDPMCEAS